MISIIDYGAGNLKSVTNAFNAIGCDTQVTHEAQDIEAASAIVLPGVGAFGDGMQSLRETGLVDVLTEQVINNGKPFLGICLGLQLIAEVSYEQGTHEGLGWVSGKVIKIQPGDAKYRVPHIGWNDIDISALETPLFKGLTDQPAFYFVHSYHFLPNPGNTELDVTTCWHGHEITASIHRENIWAVQFHPEKSQQNGLTLLKNFAESI